MPKRINKHRHGSKGVKLFDLSLPSDKFVDHLFTELPQQEDYGLDGIVQVFLNEEHTGQLYTVQIKTEKAIYIDKKGNLIFYLDLDKAKFLIETLKYPNVLVICDLSTRKVYWHDIQTNKKTLDEYHRVIKEDGTEVKIILNKSYFLPESSEQLYSYVHSAAAKLNKREEIRRISNNSLAIAMEEINQYENEVLSLKGYDIHYGTNLSEDIKRRLVFSTIDQKNGKQINYLANRDLTPEDLPKIKTKFVFPNSEEGTKKFQELKDVLEGKKDFVEISGDYIKEVESSTFTKVISDSTNGQYSMIKIGVPTTESELFLKSLISDNEIRIKANIWHSKKNLLNLDSSGFANQPLTIKMTLNPKDNACSFIYSLDFTKFDNVGDLFFYLNFIEEIKEQGEIYSYINGIKRVLFKLNETSIKKINQTDHPYFQLFKQLAFIQEKTKTRIPYPIPDTIAADDVKSISMLYEMIANGKAKMTIKASFKFDQVIKENDPITYTTSFSNYSIFGIPINLPNKNVKIHGTITKLTKQDNIYNIEVDDAEISFHTPQT